MIIWCKTKLKQIEQECALLKKCCETLSEENRRLKKKLREARCSSKLDLDQQQPQLPPSFYIRYSSKTDAGPSVKERALFFKEAQDSVKKRPLFKIA
ncbi:hypothetical protein Tco_1465452 [Tanacetum coccineum]